MGSRRAVLLVVTLVGAGLLAGCGSGSTPLLHGGKLGPRLGVQVGYLMPVDGGDQEFGGGITGGLALRMGANLASPWGIELGAAYCSALEANEGPDASVELLLLRARVLHGAGIGGFCWRFGMQMVRQNPKESGRSLDQHDGAAFDFGFLFGQRYEMGFNYSILYESENVPGTAEVTLGINF